MKCILVILLIIISLSLKAQYLANPSFEGSVGKSISPPHWYKCDGCSSPDTAPVKESEGKASDGDTFVALMSRGKSSSCANRCEDIQTRLLKPLLRGECFSFSIDLFNSKNYFNESLPVIFEVIGGNTSCKETELFVRTEPIKNDTWKTYNFSIAPTIDDINYLILRVDYASDSIYYGNVMIDNIVIEQKESHIIQIDTSVIYNEPLSLKASSGENYSWKPEIGINCTDCQNVTIHDSYSTKYIVNYIKEDACFLEIFNIDYSFFNTLLRDECYSFSIDLLNINKNAPASLEIFGGDENCNNNELIIKTEPIKNDTFQTNTFFITPSIDNINCLLLKSSNNGQSMSFEDVVFKDIIIEQKERQIAEFDIVTTYNETLLLSASDGQHYLWKPDSEIDCSNCQNVNIYESNFDKYTVDFIKEGNCYREIFNIDFKLLIPNAITPNNDGFNDYFKIAGLEENSELTIINRQGIEVYKSFDYDNTWNAEYEGKKLKPDTYWYTLKIPSKPEPYTGFIYVTY